VEQDGSAKGCEQGVSAKGLEQGGSAKGHEQGGPLMDREQGGSKVVLLHNIGTLAPFGFKAKRRGYQDVIK
jgi:hypothetical protein